MRFIFFLEHVFFAVQPQCDLILKIQYPIEKLDVKNDIKNDVKNYVKNDVKNDVNNHVKNEVKNWDSFLRRFLCHF